MQSNAISHNKACIKTEWRDFRKIYNFKRMFRVKETGALSTSEFGIVRSEKRDKNALLSLLKQHGENVDIRAFFENAYLTVFTT